MFKKSLLPLLLISCATTSAVVSQVGKLQGQGFTDCDLDVRPDNRPEVDVYWTEAPMGQTGEQFIMWGPEDGVLDLGFPDGSDEIPLKKGAPNTATFVYDAAKNEVKLTTSNGSTTKGPTVIPTVGTYNPLLPLETPTYTRVRPPAANKERVLVTGRNYGLEFSYTLTRTIK